MHLRTQIRLERVYDHVKKGYAILTTEADSIYYFFTRGSGS
jgi:hypothetical protein